MRIRRFRGGAGVTVAVVIGIVVGFLLGQLQGGSVALAAALVSAAAILAAAAIPIATVFAVMRYEPPQAAQVDRQVIEAWMSAESARLEAGCKASAALEAHEEDALECSGASGDAATALAVPMQREDREPIENEQQNHQAKG